MPRVPEYDRGRVVDQAMAVFWERGYGRTSVGDLVAATGLKPGSLYAAFGSKKGVFLEVLDHYNRDFLAHLRTLAASQSPKITIIRDLFTDIARMAASGEDRRGCLSVNALLELAQHEPDIAARIDRHNRAVRDAFAELLSAAQADNELPAGKDPDAMAAFLVNNIWGIRVSCKARPERLAIDAIVDGVVAGLRA